MLKRTLTAAAAIAAALALTVTQARAAEITTSGTGWKINTGEKVKALAPSRTNTIVFSSTAIKNWYAPYLSRSLTQLRAEGVKVAVGGVMAMSTAACPPRGTIYFTEAYRPLAGRPGYSRAGSCVDSQGVHYSGIVWMDSEYRSGTWKLGAALSHNLPPHELLHAFGLDHPNYDKDRDGTVEAYECVATSYGNKPLMCSPNGGYQTTANRGKLVGYDINGVRALLRNAKVLGVK